MPDNNEKSTPDSSQEKPPSKYSELDKSDAARKSSSDPEPTPDPMPLKKNDDHKNEDEEKK